MTILNSELVLYSTGIPKVVLNFATANVDLFQLYQLLNSKLTWSIDRGTGDVIDPEPPNVDVQQSTVGNVIDWLGDNAQQVDAPTVEQRFKTEFPILLQDETVELAF